MNMMNKLFILLYIIFILFLVSCRTTTIVVVPVPNVEIPIYPPQISSNKMSYNTNYYNYFAYSHLIEMNNMEKYLYE